jgi:class 3 adenylate cyclase/predicted ATPase
VTALFADIKGSMELMEDLDPEEARAIVDPALRIMVEVVRDYDGYVVQSTGDGIFALFGAPVAHEDHPQRALYAALRILEALRDHTQRLAAEGEPAVEARVGVNSGEVVMRTVETGGRVEYTPVGHATNLAARLQTVAPPGGIVISDDTQRLVEGYFELRDLGPAKVKGLSRPIDIYQVMGIGPLRGHFEVAARRGLTKFVGREDKLARIQRRFESACAGQGQIVAVVAEAGIGKSRLFREFRVMIPAECKLFEAYSVSYGKASAWLPVLDLLRGYFGIQNADDSGRRREKVCAALAALDPSLQDLLPYLLGLFGIVEGADPLAQMDPQVKLRRTLDAIKRIILRESLNQPLIIIFEDLHWIDTQSQALLDLLADSIATSRVLLLVNYRPEYRDEWTNKSYYYQFCLDPLGRESADEMLSALLGTSTSAATPSSDASRETPRSDQEISERAKTKEDIERLKLTIVERTAGNPFFMEEIVQALFQQGILAREGVVRLVQPLSKAHLPVTVQAMLAARIDRQSEEDKELLHTLAVIGNEFPLALARQVTRKRDEELKRGLANLQLGEFVYEHQGTDEVKYSFKHALTHEVAYNSVLIERRKLLHERSGQALESIYAEQLEHHLGELARHYSRSDNVSKAIEYLGRAGQQAMQRSAHTDAIRDLSAAIEMLQRLPDTPERTQTELMLQLSLSLPLAATKGYASPELEAVFARARYLCTQASEAPQLFPVLWGVWLFHTARAEHMTARDLARECLRLAEKTGDPILLLAAHHALGVSLTTLADFEPALEHEEQTIKLYDQDRHAVLAFQFGHDFGVVARSSAALDLFYLGYAKRALTMTEEALGLARKVSHPHSLALALVYAARLHRMCRDPRRTQERAEEALKLCGDSNFGFWRPVALIFRGWALAQGAEIAEGIGEIREGLTAFRTTGAGVGLPTFLAALADAYGRAGQPEEGLDALGEAHAIVKQSEERWSEPELYQLEGELTLKLSDTQRPVLAHQKRAEECFLRARDIASKQKAKLLEVRAILGLHRLWSTLGKGAEARRMLEEIYGWFTEGFDTADLKDAKALLEELSA